MKDRYILAVDNSTVDQDKAFIQYLTENKYGFWHWISNFWLIVDTQEKIGKASDLRDIALTHFPNNQYMVAFKLNSSDEIWSGFGPSGEGEDKNMFNWLKDQWPPKP